MTSALVVASLLVMPRTILSPTFISFENNGHYYEFQILKSGGLRLAFLDGRLNSRGNSCRTGASEASWNSAWDRARQEAASRIGRAA